MTPEEHFIAHQLLIKIHPNHWGLISACFYMCTDAHGNRINNKGFGWIRRKISSCQKGQTKQSCERIAKMAESLNILTPEQRKQVVQMRDSGLNFTQIFNWFNENGIKIRIPYN